MRSRPAAAPQTQTLLWLEYAFVIVAFQIIMGRDVLFDLFGGGGPTNDFNAADPGNRDGGSNMLNLVPLFLVYSGSFFFFILRGNYKGLLTAKHASIFLLLLIAMASVLWSDTPSVTVRRAIGLVGTTAFGAYVALAFAPMVGMRLTAIAAAVFCILSLFAAVAAPSIGTHTVGPHTGLWHGLGGHKNSFARDVVVCAFIFLTYFLSQETFLQKRVILACLIGVCCILLLGAWSGGGLIGFALLSMLFVALRPMAGAGRVHLPVLIVGGVLCGILYLIGAFFVDDVLALLGKDPSLTGRTLIWEAAIMVGSERPFLGYGFKTFWVGPSAEAVYGHLGRGLHGVGAAHSRFLDLWLELGLVGILTLVWFYVGILRRGLQAIAADPAPLNMAPIMFLAIGTVYAVAGGGLVDQGEVVWVVVVMGWFWLAAERLPISTRARSRTASAAEATAGQTLATARSKLRWQHQRPTTLIGRRWRSS